VCQRTKINYNPKYAPLHTLPIPDEVGARFSMDHKPLCRTTNAGNSAILVIVEAFSGFPHLIPVSDMTAQTTARAIVNHVVPLWGIGFSLYSDKLPSFVNALFAHINTLLGIRHVASASRSARSKGMAEHLKFCAKDDYSIEEVLPVIEVNLRSTPHLKIGLSPYEIVFGRCMRLGIPGDPNSVPSPTPPEVLPDRVSYYKWLSTELNRMHETAKMTRDEVKITDKAKYDKSHKVFEPSWQVGDIVLLQETQVKAGASKVLTRQRFFGPYVIKAVVCGRSDVGQAYQLVDETTGKTLRNLVTNDRLKQYNVDRENFNTRLSKIQTTIDAQRSSVVDQGQQSSAEATPIEILSEHVKRGKKQYRVKYTDGRSYRCDWVNKALMDHYKRKQSDQSTNNMQTYTSNRRPRN